MNREDIDKLSKRELSQAIYNTLRGKTILANQNALAHNEVLRKTPVWKGKIKEYGNPLITQLIKAEKDEFEKIEAVGEKMAKNVIDEAFKKSGLIINKLSKAVFVDYDEANIVFDALAIDNKSMVGLAKKILKHNK